MVTSSKPRVYFNTYRNNKCIRSQLANFDNEKRIYSGVEIKEFENIKVELKSEDNDAFVKIQLDADKNPTTIFANSGEIELLEGGNTESMLVPDYYLFEIRSSTQNYSAFFKITSQHFPSEELLNLKEYLNKLIRGLIYDLNHKKYGLSPEEGLTIGSLIQFYDKINRERSQILNILKSVIDDPIENISNEYQIRPYTRNPDLKSIRWQISKGETKGGTADKPLVYNEKQTILSRENLENQWIKYILQELLEVFRSVNQSLNVEKNHITKRQESLLLRKKENKAKRNRFKRNRYAYRNQLRRLKREIKRQREERKEIDKRLKSVTDRIQTIKWWKTSLILIKEDYWLQNIKEERPKRVPKSLLRDWRYKKIYDYYKKLYKIKKKDTTLDTYSDMQRRTWELYEYYTVGLVVDILQELGYDWESGWLADYDDLYLSSGLGGLPQDTLMYFKSKEGDHYIELAYDYRMEQSYNKKIEKGQYFHLRQRRPDIRLTILDSSKSIYSRVDSTIKPGLIIEVKYRNHGNILGRKYSTDVKEQLIDFLDLRYYDPKLFDEKLEPEEPIKQVIVVYPKQNRGKAFERDREYGNRIVYLQLSPSNQDDADSPFGYKRLKEKIEIFLNQIQKEAISNE